MTNAVNRKARRAFISLLLLLAVVSVPMGLTYHEWRQQQRNVQLIVAVKGYDLDRVLDLLQQGADPNVRDEAHPEVSYWQILREWLHRRKQVTQHANSLPAILIAVQNTDMQMAMALATRSSIAIDGRSPGMNEAATLAAMHKHTDLTWKLIERGAGQTVNECGQLLIAAATIGDVRLARYALSHGANADLYVNINEYMGIMDMEWAGYPLFPAVEGGNLEIAAMLLQQGANPEIGHVLLGSPLQAAAGDGNNAMVKLLLKHGAKVDYTDRIGTALCFAAENGHLEVAKTLVAAGADVNYSGNSGSVLTRAVYAEDTSKWSRMQMIKFLLAKGAKVNGTVRGDWTALLSAAGSGRIEIAEILLEHGANINHASAGRYTPLSHAAENGHIETVRLLLSRGAHIKVIGYPAYDEYPKAALIDALAVAKDSRIRVLLQQHSRNR